MGVAEAFGKFQPDWDLKGLTIDASALYLLAKPTIPPEVLAEAVEKATIGNSTGCFEF